MPKKKDGKCCIDVHFAIAMAHMVHHVAMINEFITLAQIVAALNLNGGVGKTKSMLYNINRMRMKTFET